MEPFVTIARIVKTWGVRGEVAAALLTDFPERFEGLSSVRVSRGGDGNFETLLQHRFHKGRVILKFEGVDNPEQARRLVGGEVQVPGDQRVSPPPGTYFDSDLVGCLLREDGRPVGVVRDVFKAAGSAANLVLETTDGHEAMVPLVRRFILDVDVEGKTIDAKLPPGLLEVARTAPGGKKRSKRRKKAAGRKAPGQSSDEN